MFTFKRMFPITSIDVHSEGSTTVMKTAGKLALEDATEVSDEDITTCVTVSAERPSIIRVYIDSYQNVSATVKILTSYDSPCSVDKTTDVYAMVDLVPSDSFTGPFQKCSLWQKYEESTLNAHLYNCTCSYDVCFQFYVRISSQCSVNVCSIELL